MKAEWRNRLAALVLGVAACSPAERDEPAQADSAGGTAAIGDMPGMAHTGGMESERMMAEMRAHMQGMAGAGADSLGRMTAMHRQMTANMLQQMDAEMREMRMSSSAAWSALTDSVRQDLTGMPEVGADELPRFMERHRARVERLMAHHDVMMKAH